MRSELARRGAPVRCQAVHQPARSAGSRQGADAQSAHSTHLVPAWWQSHAHGLTPAPGRDPKHSSRPDLTILPSRQITSTADQTAVVLTENAPVAQTRALATNSGILGGV